MNANNRENAATRPRKAELRRKMHDLMEALPPIEHRRMSLAASACLMASPLWQRAKTLYLFANLGQEIDTKPLLRAAWQEGKTVCLPKCRKGQPGYMDFWPCSSMDDLAPGTMGILEPVLPLGGSAAPLANPAPDMVIFPVLACSPQGNRLGYGGGYYDRFFADHSFPRSVFVAFCLGVQLVQSLPQDPWDICVAHICTEKGLVLATGHGKETR